MANPTLHTGGCHCGAVRFHVELDLSEPAYACNCSICERTGTLLQFVSPSAFTLEKGEENLTDYQFNRKVIHHLFCKTCGIRSFARGSGPNGPAIAVNVRCLDDFDRAAVPVESVNGKAV